MNIRVVKKPDIGIPRISLGGVPWQGFYCVYRGSKEEAIYIMEHTLIAMKEMAKVMGDKEPDIQPDKEGEEPE